jgi:dihydrofolate reductase
MSGCAADRRGLRCARRIAVRRNRRLDGEPQGDGREPGIDRVEGCRVMDLTAGSDEPGGVRLEGAGTRGAERVAAFSRYARGAKRALLDGAAAAVRPHRRPGAPRSAQPPDPRDLAEKVAAGQTRGAWQSGAVGKSQYYTATTLDGYIADENNSLDWLFEVDRTDAGEHSFAAFFAEVGAMAMGATTYEWILEHDRLLDDPDKWRGYYGATPCWVFTHRKLPPIPGAEIVFVEGDVAPVHEQMTRAAAGKNIWLVGGGDLVGQFADRQLLDEILVSVAPVTLGRGAPLLPRRLTSSQLELVDVGRDRQFARLSYRLRK